MADDEGRTTTGTCGLSTCDQPAVGIRCPDHARQAADTFKGRTPSCAVADCTFSAACGSAYCTLHGVKWGRSEQHHWEPLRSVPPSWRCRDCGRVTETAPARETT